MLYSELNPSSPNYNPALEKKIAADYRSKVLSTNANGQTVVNPNVKLADVAKENVEFFHEAMEAGKAQTTTALESQAGEAALTPTAVSPEPDKKFEDLPLEEMEQRLRAQGRDI